MTRRVLFGGPVVTMNGTEYADGHVIIEGSRIAAVGPGRPPEQPSGTEYVDTSGCLVTPGLVNAHTHANQWATRGHALDADPQDWLGELYLAWARIDEELTYASASAALGWVALSGCTTAADHHYIFPTRGGDPFGAVIAAARRIGLRIHAVRGSMDRGTSMGAQPPDHVIEDTDAALAATESAIERFHDPTPNALVRVAVGPCTPFTSTTTLMREAADLARRHRVRLHTHLVETSDEELQCRAEFGCSLTQYVDELGWLGPDVWLAHAVFLSLDTVGRIADTGTSVAQCPSSIAKVGAGVTAVRRLLDADVPVGLGTDGATSNEAGVLGLEMRQALLVARASFGVGSLSVRDALWMATMGGARCLGRENEIGSLEPGKLADIAVWRLDGLGHAGITDPISALVLGPPASVALLLRGGVPIVEDGELVRSSADELTRELRVALGAFREVAR